MKIVIIGGTGLIGSKVVAILSGKGHAVIAASPKGGVNAVTGEGLEDALAGADVVVDVANSPSWADDDVMAFFTGSSRNLLAAESQAGVKHHVALSIVNAERMPNSGYMRAKVAQENIIKDGRIPYTIVRATQFMEFMAGIGQGSVVEGAIRLSPALIQPIASDDVAAAVAEAAIAAPLNGTVEVAGPEQFRLDLIVGRALAAIGETRAIVTDPKALYFGTELDDTSLVPASNSKVRLGKLRYDDWQRQ
ncbi:NAD(P)H-binding protein [Pseudoduganella eburnea]|uniref:NAD(P)H-binding protein n=1 Tax=Massilia eburnea TaxID=1776165 RepID=A0A6L6QBT3_9BURK|nr:SDR family oxidoreductase [Massilia eburnea]MTW09569.1 NAD(P)H-binding protein [Massilia eburnea]